MQFLDETLDINHFIKGKTIKKGKTNKVFEVINKQTNVIYAAKTPIKDFSEFTREEITNYCHDINIISKLNHPSILNFIGYSPTDFKNRNKPVIVTEYALNNTLSKLLQPINKDLNEFDETKKLINIYGIASGMSYAHSHNIIHCDLTSKNILIDSNFYPKLFNFGSSKEITNDSLTEYPEDINILEKSKYNDVYSFSLIISEILTNKQPLKESIPQCYYQLIEKCRSSNPEERPTFDQIINNLETNTEFITETVNEEEYKNYIQMIKDSPITFDSTPSILDPNYLIEKIEKEKRSKTIENLLTTQKAKELIQYLNNNCDDETTSSIFDRCLIEFPDTFSLLCEEGISLHNSVAHNKFALFLISKDDTDELTLQKAKFHLEESIRLGFARSCFFLALLSFEKFHNKTMALDLAKRGAEMGDTHSECLLGFFIARGIGTEKDHRMGVSLMMKSGAADFCDLHATDIGIFYIEEMNKANAIRYLIKESEKSGETSFDENEQEINENKKNSCDYEISDAKLANDDTKETCELKSIDVDSVNVNSSCGFEIEEEEEDREFSGDGCDGGGDEISENELDYDCDALVEYDKVIEYEYEESLDDHLAFKWFEKAYNAKKTRATANNYALCFLLGIGVAKDSEKANEILGKIDANPSDSDLAFILDDDDQTESLKNYINSELSHFNEERIEYDNFNEKQTMSLKNNSNEFTKENEDKQTTTTNGQSQEEQTESLKNNANEECIEYDNFDEKQTESHKNNSNEFSKENEDEQTTTTNIQSQEKQTESLKNNRPAAHEVTHHSEIPHSSFSVTTNTERCLKNAAEAGDANSMQILTVKYSTENDSENTYNYIKKMVHAGNFLVPIEYALNLYKLKKFEQAFNYFSMISNGNNPIAKYFVAVMKYKGEGCIKDVNEAYNILKNLSDNGIDRASEFLDDNF